MTALGSHAPAVSSVGRTLVCGGHAALTFFWMHFSLSLSRGRMRMWGAGLPVPHAEGSVAWREH